jgi:hypothetical protein
MKLSLFVTVLCVTAGLGVADDHTFTCEIMDNQCGEFAKPDPRRKIVTWWP